MNLDQPHADATKRAETVSRRTVVGRVVAGAVVTPARAAYTSPKIMTLGLLSPATLLASGPVRPPSSGGDEEPKPPSEAPSGGGPSSSTDVTNLPKTGVGIN